MTVKAAKVECSQEHSLAGVEEGSPLTQSPSLEATLLCFRPTDRFWRIVLQKSQNAVRLNFRQRTKQAAIVDRCRFKRATEVVGEFVTD
ncbi:MAG: hypothetical protein WBF73_29640 [Bradyrhizobium sp.]